MTNNWTLKSGNVTTECASFPYAFRTAYNNVRKAIEAKQSPSGLIQNITILGPVNARGERIKYNYAEAVELARSMDILTIDGNINSKNMKVGR